MMATSMFSMRPTVSIEMDNRHRKPRIARGVRLVHVDGARANKIAQYRRFDELDLPAPEWCEITPQTSLDPAAWGQYVVVKPSQGRRGAFITIQRTSRVRFRTAEEYPENHLGRLGPMLAQRFIYTGPWPVSYRVLTYFGEPVLACRYEGRRDLAALEGVDGLKKAGGGLSIVAPARGCTISLAFDDDVIDLARRAHNVFPDIPSVGVDIVREQETGKLYLIEINTGGQSWFLTNDSGAEMQTQFGFDFYTQFGAVDLIANRSIEIAREYAR